MFLAALEIQNFRSIAHQRLDFSGEDGAVRKRTVFIGDNGTGKTSILQAIGLVMAGSDCLPALVGDPNDWIRAGEVKCRIVAHIVTKAGRPREVELELVRDQGVAELLRHNQENLERLDAALGHSPRNYLTIGYGPFRRLGGGSGASLDRINVSNRALRSRSVATLFDCDASLISVQAWAMDVHYRGGDTGLGQVMQALNLLLPGLEFSHLDRDDGDLIFNTPDGLLPLRMLNGGFQMMASWCGDLLYRVGEVFKDYENPLEARGLLLLDEIELHLHPRWQRELVEFLDERLPNFQIIGTTHSPLLAQQMGENELHVVTRSRDDPATQIEVFHGSPQRLMAHQMLLDPSFGISTMESFQVERMRTEYRALRAAPQLDADQSARLQELGILLDDLPVWGAETELDRENRDLMRDIRNALTGQTP